MECSGSTGRLRGATVKVLGQVDIEPGAGAIERDLCEIGQDELPVVGEEGFCDRKAILEAPPVTIATPRSVMMASPHPLNTPVFPLLTDLHDATSHGIPRQKSRARNAWYFH